MKAILSIIPLIPIFFTGCFFHVGTTANQISKLKIGMTKTKIRQIIGSPTIESESLAVYKHVRHTEESWSFTFNSYTAIEFKKGKSTRIKQVDIDKKQVRKRFNKFADHYNQLFDGGYPIKLSWLKSEKEEEWERAFKDPKDPETKNAAEQLKQIGLSNLEDLRDYWIASILGEVFGDEFIKFFDLEKYAPEEIKTHYYDKFPEWFRNTKSYDYTFLFWCAGNLGQFYED